MTDTPEAPARRERRRAGFTGKEAFDFADRRLRAALSVLARDEDPAARITGATIAEEAARLLDELTARADASSTKARYAREKTVRVGQQLDEALRRAGRRPDQ